MRKNIIMCFIISMMSLHSMELEQIREEYRCCPEPYSDPGCNAQRRFFSPVAGSTICLGSANKVAMYIGPWCKYVPDQPCTQACSCDTLWFPTDCSSSTQGCLTAMGCSTSLCLITGIITMGCLWAPWWNKNGCNLIKKVPVRQQIFDSNDENDD